MVWPGYFGMAVKQVLCDVGDTLCECVLDHELTLHISGIVVTMSACLSKAGIAVQ